MCLSRSELKQPPSAEKAAEKLSKMSANTNQFRFSMRIANAKMLIVLSLFFPDTFTPTLHYKKYMFCQKTGSY